MLFPRSFVAASLIGLVTCAPTTPAPAKNPITTPFYAQLTGVSTNSAHGGYLTIQSVQVGHTVQTTAHWTALKPAKPSAQLTTSKAMYMLTNGPGKEFSASLRTDGAVNIQGGNGPALAWNYDSTKNTFSAVNSAGKALTIQTCPQTGDAVWAGYSLSPACIAWTVSPVWS